MEYDMKIIPTMYNGKLFRSRLEARWAVYFSQKRIVYSYESKKFDLENGEVYIPDFYLAEHKLYVEIKPFKCNDYKWQLFFNCLLRQTDCERDFCVLDFGLKPKTIISYRGNDIYLFKDKCAFDSAKNKKFGKYFL
jgi:hypothetical protein